MLASQGNFEAAVRIPTDQLQANPSDAAALEQLASILSDIGDAARLQPVVQTSRSRRRRRTPGRTTTPPPCSSSRDRLDTALQAARNAVTLDPNNAKAHNLVGACLASLGQNDAARTAFETSIKLDPREAGTYANLATLELQIGNRERALKHFAEALTIDPNNRPAQEGLASLTSNSSR